MKNVLGIVNLHHQMNLGTLTDRRSIASTSFLARYAFIDFALSNFSNSMVNEIGLLIKEHPRSLFKHLGMGKEWSFNTKTGGITMLYNEQYTHAPQYNHDINNLEENIFFLEQSSIDYVVIAPVHIIMKINYKEVIAYHKAHKAEITMVYAQVGNARDSFIDGDYINLDDQGYVNKIRENKGSEDNRLISLETYVFNRARLLKLMNQAKKISAFFSLRDILMYICSKEPILGYEHKGFAQSVDSLKSYFQTSLSMLSPNNLKAVLSHDWPIYTRTFDTPPAMYGEHALVHDCIVGNGARINGKVEHSIIGRDVVVEAGAIVRNSIILSRATIGAGVTLENVIVDKEAKVIHVKKLIGSEVEPLVIKQGDVV